MALSAAPAYASCTNPGNNCGNPGGGNGGGGNLGGLSGGLSGSISGSASSFAGTAGIATGNGNVVSEAGNFSANRGTLSGGLTEGSTVNSGGLEATITSESFTEGFARNRQNGDALGGSIQFGTAWGDGEYTGWGSGSW